MTIAVAKSRKEKILAVIPARGGSKGVARKNVRPICGKPLIVYTIETALAARHILDRIIVSTDDEEIAAIARQSGADVPFMRPPELAGDQTPTLPVLQHAVNFIETAEDLTLDWVLLLQPTTPLRIVEDIETSINLTRQNRCDSVISVVQVFAEHPIFMKRIENNRLLAYCLEEKEGTRRQDIGPPAYMKNGAIYLTRRDVLMENDSIWGNVIQPYVMPPERSVNIDNEIDLKLAEVLISQRINMESSKGNSK